MKRSALATRTASLHLLGTGWLEIAGQRIALPTKRSLAMLSVLALEGRVQRSRLAYMLWDEGSVEDPRRNLRQELYRLSKLPLGDLLVQDGEFFELQAADCDAVQLERAVRDEDWRLALGLTGDLLERFNLLSAPEFEVWLEVRRARVREARAVALGGLSAQLEASQQWGLALELRLERLKTDPWNEADHRAVLRLHAHAGQLDLARAHYQRLERDLRAELALEPLVETTALMLELQSVGAPSQAFRLPEDALSKRALEVAALLGDDFAYAELRGASDLSDDALSAALDAAVTEGTLAIAHDDRFAFQNPALMRTLIHNLRPARRRMLHGRLARNLERLGAGPQRIARQLAGAGQADKAAQQWLRAALLARRAADHDAATSHYEAAAGLFTAPLEQIGALRGAVQIAELRYRLADRDGLIARIEGLSAASGEGLHLALLERARWQLDNARYSEALENAEDLLNDALLIGPDVAMAQFVAGAAAFRLGRLVEARGRFESTLKDAGKLTSERAGAAYHLAAIAFTEGRFEDSLASLTLCSRVSDAIHHVVLRVNAALLWSALENSCGHSALALDHATRAATLAAQSDLGVQRQAALQIQSAVLLTLNRLEEALVAAQSALELPSTPYIEGVLTMTLGRLQLARGALGEALQLVESAVTNADQLGMNALRAMRRAMFAEMLVWCGDTEQAKIVCAQALEIAEPLGLQAQIGRTRLTLGLIALREQQFHEVIGLLDALRFTEIGVEAERLIAWAAARNALGQAVTLTPDLSLASGVQRLRWQLEVRSLSPAQLEGNAARLRDPGPELFETLQARRALLRLHPDETLRRLHERDLERLSANLPIDLRESFRLIHR